MAKTNLTIFSDKELLEQKISSFNLKLPSKYEFQIQRLYKTLKNKKIMWQPHFWLSNEWFCPDGVAGLAIPFVLADTRLINLEKEYLGFCEGEDPEEFFKLLCHETGHAIDNAFRLRRKKYRQALFGKTSKSYPRSYRPNPSSSDFVFFLEDYYAQAHPDEDWAETFAVWLTSSSWRKDYQGTKALIKLLYVDQIMEEIAENPFYKNTTKTMENYKRDKRTVREYLTKKRKGLKLERELFSKHIIECGFSATSGRRAAVQFIQRKEGKLIDSLHEETGVDKWSLRKFLRDVTDTCKQNGYKLKLDERSTEEFLFDYIKDHIDEFIKTGRTKVYM